MAQDVTIAGATYSDVPAIDVPLADGQGTARFYGPSSIQFPVTSVNNQTGDVELKTSDLANDSGYITGMTILSYGSSTWQNFLDAYNAKKVVYCRASSNTNPATGSQTRLAFMAYVNNADNPTNVEFQYYRSVSSHSATQQGDQVYVYKLDKTAGWTVTVRESYTKIVAGTGLSSSYSSGALTLSSSISVPTASDATPQPTGTASAGSSSDYSRADHVHAKPTYTASDVGALPANTEIHNVPSGGSAGQVLTKNSGTNYDASWITPSGGGDILLCEVDSVQYTSSMTSSEIEDAISDGKKVILVWKDSSNNEFPGGFFYCLGGDAYASVTYIYSDEINYIELYIDSNGYPDWNTYVYPMLPSVSSSDEGKVLRVVNGVWAAEELPSASGVSF